MINDDYFIICQPREDDKRHDLLPILGPDEDTAKLRYRTEPLPVGHKPLIFDNAAKQMFQRRGYTTIKNPPDILFEGSAPLVRGNIREKILALDIPDLVLQPSIYIDDWGKWHEDYWYLTFLNDFDGWDRKTSDIGEKVWIVDEYFYEVYRVSFDDDEMSRIPLKQRLLFQLKSMPSLIVAHKSVASIFSKKDSGALVISLSDYPNRP